MEIIQEIAQCVPVSYTVDLDNPDVFILVEVFKACSFLFTPLGRVLTRAHTTERMWCEHPERLLSMSKVQRDDPCS